MSYERGHEVGNGTWQESKNWRIDGSVYDYDTWYACIKFSMSKWQNYMYHSSISLWTYVVVWMAFMDSCVWMHGPWGVALLGGLTLLE